jgi:hypothetical protein
MQLSGKSGNLVLPDEWEPCELLAKYNTISFVDSYIQMRSLMFTL